MYTTKRSDAAMELINEFKTHDLTRKSSNDVVRPSKFKVTSKTTEEKNVPIPAASPDRHISDEFAKLAGKSTKSVCSTGGLSPHRRQPMPH